MEKKNVILVIVIALILLGVGAFFAINLMRGRVYERIPDPDALTTHSYLEIQPSETSVQEAETSAQEAETEKQTPESASSTEPGLDPEIAAKMDQIEEQVRALRQLETETRIPRMLLSNAELKERVLNDFLEEYEEEDELEDVRIMSMFGLLPKDFALLDFYLDLYSEQIAGFYDTEEKAMYVIGDAGFGGMERFTYAHEYVHVLQDAVFGFEDNLKYTDEYCKEDTERCLALQSLIEGDATLTQSMWFQNYATKKDFQDLQSFYSSYKSPILDNAPEYMKSDFTFPYLYGLQFVQTLYSEGGYELIDKAYIEQQPVSSEQIMHPEAYPDDVPNNPELPDLAASLGDDWELIQKNVMGEWSTYLVLAKGYEATYRLQDGIAQAAAEGWGGDRYVVLRNETAGEYLITAVYNWDSSADASEALQAFRNYSNLRFGTAAAGDQWQGDDLFSSLYQISPDSFVWILAESEEALSAAQALLHN